MGNPQTVTEGVTVTWANSAPAPRRRTVRSRHPVTVRTVEVRDPMPTEAEVDRVLRGGRHEHLAALLAGTADAGTALDVAGLRRLARSLTGQGVERDTVLLALILAGHPDAIAVSAVWWGSLDDKRTLVLTLPQHAGRTGDRVHDALRAMGFPCGSGRA